MDASCMPGVGLNQHQLSPPLLIPTSSSYSYSVEPPPGTTCTCTCNCPSSPTAQSSGVSLSPSGPLPALQSPFSAPLTPATSVLIPATSALAGPGTQRLHDLLLEATTSAARRQEGQKRSSATNSNSGNSDNNNSAGSGSTVSSGSSPERPTLPPPKAAKKRRISSTIGTQRNREAGFPLAVGSTSTGTLAEQFQPSSWTAPSADCVPGTEAGLTNPLPSVPMAARYPPACVESEEQQRQQQQQGADCSMALPAPQGRIGAAPATGLQRAADSAGIPQAHSSSGTQALATPAQLGPRIPAPRGAPNLPVPRSFAQRFLARMAGAKLQGDPCTGPAPSAPGQPPVPSGIFGTGAQGEGGREGLSGPGHAGNVKEEVQFTSSEGLKETGRSCPAPARRLLPPLPPPVQASAAGPTATEGASVIPSRILPPRPAPQSFFLLPQGLSPAALLGSPSPVLLRSASLPSPTATAIAAEGSHATPAAAVSDRAHRLSSLATPAAEQEGQDAGQDRGRDGNGTEATVSDTLLSLSLPSSPGVLFPGSGFSFRPLPPVQPPLSPWSPLGAYTFPGDPVPLGPASEQVSDGLQRECHGVTEGVPSPEESPCRCQHSPEGMEPDPTRGEWENKPPREDTQSLLSLRNDGPSLEAGGLGPDCSLPGLGEDGFSWRKYGQKQVKGSERPRGYYKCSVAGCPARKKVELADDRHTWVESSRSGAHNHPPPDHPRRATTRGEGPAEGALFGEGGQDPCPTPSAPFEGSQFSSGDEEEEEGEEEVERQAGKAAAAGGTKRGSGDAGGPSKRRRPLPFCGQRKLRDSKFVIEADSNVELLDDGYRWRKYGQKVVKGHLNPRSYYKCTSPGCPVRKHVERSQTDPRKVVTTYEGRHNHEVPHLGPPPAVSSFELMPDFGGIEAPGLSYVSLPPSVLPTSTLEDSAEGMANTFPSTQAIPFSSSQPSSQSPASGPAPAIPPGHVYTTAEIQHAQTASSRSFPSCLGGSSDSPSCDLSTAALFQNPHQATAQDHGQPPSAPALLPSPAFAPEVARQLASLLQVHSVGVSHGHASEGPAPTISNVAASAASALAAAAAAAAAAGLPAGQGQGGPMDAVQLLASAVSAAEQCLSALASGEGPRSSP